MTQHVPNILKNGILQPKIATKKIFCNPTKVFATNKNCNPSNQHCNQKSIALAMNCLRPFASKKFATIRNKKSFCNHLNKKKCILLATKKICNQKLQKQTFFATKTFCDQKRPRSCDAAARVRLWRLRLGPYLPSRAAFPWAVLPRPYTSHQGVGPVGENLYGQLGFASTQARFPIGLCHKEHSGVLVVFARLQHHCASNKA